MVVKILKKGNSAPVSAPEGVVKAVVVKKKKLTILQERAVAEVAKGRKSKAEILRVAGYSEAVATHPERVFGKPEVQEALKPVLEEMTLVRDNIISALKEKDMSKQNAFNLSMMLNMLNKDIQLLSGLPTSREEYVLPAEEQAKLDKLLEMNQGT